MSSNAPLSGFLLVELGQNIAAPYAAQIFADMGAEVVKVEPPTGDDARAFGIADDKGMSPSFRAINRNKKAISLDLSDPAQRSWLRRYIIENADICLQNMRPGKIDKLGLGGAELTAENPALIYCNMGAYGKGGPLSDLPGYDPLMQAFGGVMSTTGEEDGPTVRVGTSIMDMGTGMWAAISVLAAIAERSKTGKGGIIDVSLFETALAWMSYHVTAYDTTGTIPRKHGSGTGGVAPHKAFNCADGELVISALNNKLFSAMAEAVGHPEWSADERFHTAKQRGKNRVELYSEMDPIFPARPREYWMERLNDAGVPCAPVQKVDEVVAHPQTAALNMMQTLGPDMPRVMGMPFSFDGERPPLRSDAPAIGQHNDEIIGDALAAVASPVAASKAKK